MAVLKQRIEKLELAANGGETDVVRDLIERAEVIHAAILDGDARSPDLQTTSKSQRLTWAAAELQEKIRG